MHRSRCLIILATAFLLLQPILKPSHSQESDLEEARVMQRQGEQLYRQGRYADALPIAEKVLTITKKMFGPEHPDVAESLDDLALVYYSLGHYAKAEPLFKRAWSIREQVLGSEHPDVATSLNGLADVYIALGNYGNAEPLYKRAIAIREKALGPEHPSLAQSLNGLANLYRYQGYYTKSEPLFKRALAIYEKALGPEHLAVARILSNMGHIYRSLENSIEAETFYKRSLLIREKTYGSEHPHVEPTLTSLADLYKSIGEYTKAEPLYLRALAIKERALGPEHPDVVTNLVNLAILYFWTGDHTKEVPLYKKALKIKEKALGPNHPEVAAILNNFAVTYQALGNYAQAEVLFQRSLAIDENAFGPEHPRIAADLNLMAMLYKKLGDYSKAETLYKKALAIAEKAPEVEYIDVAGILNQLGLLYKDIGDYSKAELLYKQAVALEEKAVGADHPRAVVSLLNLAMLYENVGDYAKAETLYKKALAINEKAFGTNHPRVADSLRSLAMLYGALGDYVKEESLYKRALTIDEKVFGPEHPKVALSLSTMGFSYFKTGEYAKAESSYKRALAINEKVFGPEHPYIANGLGSLSMLHEDLGDYVRAEALYERALTITEKALGPEHPDVTTRLACLATLYDKLGNYTKAEALYKRALAIDEKAFGPEWHRLALGLICMARHYAIMDDFEESKNIFKRALNIESKFIDHLMGITSEKQKFKLLSKYKPNLHAFLSLINQHLSQSPSARKDALNIWLKRKGVILEAQRRFQEALVYSEDPEAIKTFQKLSRVRDQISTLTLLTFTDSVKQDLNTYKKKIADLKAQKERLEAKVSRLSQAYALNRKIAKADCGKVARALPKNTVLMEFARIEMFDFKAKGKQKKWQPAHYLAFVLHSGKGDKVGMVDLGDAEETDKAMTRFKKEISKVKDIKGTKSIKSSGKIYDLVFKPLKKELGDIKEIFISPDGNLNLIPFEVLQGPDGRYLIEDYTFNYLTAGRDIVGFGQIKGKGDKALLMGDPDFDMGTDEKSTTLRKLALAKVSHKDIARRSSDMKELLFRRLPGARQEVKAIQALLGEDKSELYTGKQALEEVLRQSGTPKILHLATHGFFLKDQELDNIPPDPKTRGFVAFSMPIKRKGIKVRIENPMLRSGFALAGANRSLQVTEKQTDDGIVTSEEILGLRLRGTDMVVLSACDTGLGDISTGEGVFGLRRAFAQAGAKSLVMSMWSVPDKETRELMVEFYKNIKSGKMNRCQALRQAALKEMKIVKKRYGHAHPLFWGAFVMVGNPGQLN